MKLTKDDLKEAIALIFERQADGKSDVEIMDEMGIGAEDYAALRATMLDKKADEIRLRPVEHVYVEYLIAQTQNIRDLTSMIGDFKVSRQYNAMVGAVRARSDILDKLIKTGQDLGLVKREAIKHQLAGGIIIADLTNVQLKEMITKELSDLEKMMRKYGDSSVIDMDPGALHYGESLESKSTAPKIAEPTSPKTVTARALPAALPKRPGEERSKFAASATHKVSGGRRVVKD